ncbi:MAG: phosphoenolpyruvate carboxykinase (ATP) [Anaerolineales bacterium]
MPDFGAYISDYGLENHGIVNPGKVYWNLTTPMLYEAAIRRHEGVLAHLGPLMVRTGDHTGRSPRDKFLVDDPAVSADIWWGTANQPIARETFEALRQKMLAFLQNQDLFVFDGYAGADGRYRMPIRVITQYAWHNLFARNMFIREFEAEKLRQHVPQFTVIDAPRFHADPQHSGVNSQTVILLDLARRVALIGGTEYSGEIKKSIFSALNYYLPRQGVLTMHCSANYGDHRDDVALFFGLSGTGKTTLSNDPARTLIGDDEHGWSDRGIFNIEGGCYAKVIRLDAQGEPQIYQATRRFGTILENVIYNAANRRVDLDNDSITENTRASYPITHIENATRDGLGGHPRHVVFLTADAFGVLPPVSRLTPAQATYHFLNGYTARVAGTERGVDEPQPVFSACFGAPFMPLHPQEYARLLREKIERHKVKVWLLNTGWTGGPYGVGHRIPLAFTRRMLNAALRGELDDTPTYRDPYFGLYVPEHVDGIPDDLLYPQRTWRDAQAYEAQAQRLVGLFAENFNTYRAQADEDVRQAGP